MIYNTKTLGGVVGAYRKCIISVVLEKLPKLQLVGHQSLYATDEE